MALPGSGHTNASKQEHFEPHWNDTDILTTRVAPHNPEKILALSFTFIFLSSNNPLFIKLWHIRWGNSEKHKQYIWINNYPVLQVSIKSSLTWDSRWHSCNPVAQLRCNISPSQLISFLLYNAQTTLQPCPCKSRRCRKVLQIFTHSSTNKRKIKQ